MPWCRHFAPDKARLVFLAALIVHLAAGAVGWNQCLIQDDNSSFRQTQTALSAYRMLGHRYRLAYETPLFGPPWSMPFELPLYQWLVAGLATLTGWPLDPTGRAVAQAFFLLSLWPCWSLLARLGLEPRQRLVALAFLLISPFYLFWSRAFLIEATALFFTLSYLAAAWAFLDRPRLALFLLALSLGVLAALVKITTCVGAWLALALLLPSLLASPARRPRAWLWLALVGVPFAAGLLWTRYADGLKEQNEIARYLTSTSLRDWNFGSWEMRWRWHTWGCVFCHTWGLARQGALMVVCLLLSPLAGRFKPVAACALLYVVLPLVFTNLYCMHEYYTYASMVFLVGAVVLTVLGLRQRGGRRARLGGLLAGAIVLVAAYDYAEGYYPIQTANPRGPMEACRAVQEQTRPEDVIVVLGCDWSSEVPYYSRRRALMLPVWGYTPVENLPHYLETLREYRVGALVVNWQLVDDEHLAGALRDLRAAGLVAERVFLDDVYVVFALRTEGRRSSAAD
jgi:hypothetical protein